MGKRFHPRLLSELCDGDVALLPGCQDDRDDAQAAANPSVDY